MPPLISAGLWWERLKVKSEAIAADADSSVYDIGIDWIAPYNSTQHTIGLVFLRCADVNPRDKGKSWNQHVIGIIPGPKMPENLNPYMQVIVDELLRLCEEGMLVTENWEEESVSDDGAGYRKHTRTFTHRVFLGVILCDTPARAKVCNGNGQNSYSGSCTWCLFQGYGEKNAGSGRTVRFYGYLEPIVHTMVPRYVRVRLTLLSSKWAISR